MLIEIVVSEIVILAIIISILVACKPADSQGLRMKHALLIGLVILMIFLGVFHFIPQFKGKTDSITKATSDAVKKKSSKKNTDMYDIFAAECKKDGAISITDLERKVGTGEDLKNTKVYFKVYATSNEDGLYIVYPSDTSFNFVTKGNVFGLQKGDIVCVKITNGAKSLKQDNSSLTQNDSWVFKYKLVGLDTSESVKSTGNKKS